MNGLALCAGIGGMELGVRAVLPAYRTVCYVEREAYAAAILVARMEDGLLDPAPLWSDLRTFDGRPWRGVVDLVTAGFPCQPFSLAGKRRYEADERHLWPEIARIVFECEPALVFLENVSIRAFVEPWRDLRELGFHLSRPFACTAAELGAGHRRRRVFVLAYHEHSRLEVGQGQRSDPRQEQPPAERGDASTAAARFWDSEPKLERLVLRIPDRMDRDRALGNAVVPAQAAFAFESLCREALNG